MEKTLDRKKTIQILDKWTFFREKANRDEMNNCNKELVPYAESISQQEMLQHYKDAIKRRETDNILL